MQFVTSFASKRPRRSGRAFAALFGALAVGLATNGTTLAASAECPWIVKPYVSETVSFSSKGDQGPAYEILFEGSEKAQAFYAFSLAPRAASADAVDLAKAARRLEPVATPIGSVYRLPPDVARPETIYLVAAETPVAELEQIDARIEPPASPVAVAALNFRGASDVTGQLPRRSVQGHRIASADLQICAYEVATR